jgi:hypothetical protein
VNGILKQLTESVAILHQKVQEDEERLLRQANNPIAKCIQDIILEVVVPFLPVIATESIVEEADYFLLLKQSERISQYLIDEFIFQDIIHDSLITSAEAEGSEVLLHNIMKKLLEQENAWPTSRNDTTLHTAARSYVLDNYAQFIAHKVYTDTHQTPDKLDES